MPRINPSGPWVAVIIGSKSDWPKIENTEAFSIFEKCEVGCEISVISAHRNPKELREYCARALIMGANGFICAAGMAAALPGAVFAEIEGVVPVFGVALPSEDFPKAEDAILSITRLPPGIDVKFSGVGKDGLNKAAIDIVKIISFGSDMRCERIRNLLNEYLNGKKKIPEIAFYQNKWMGGQKDVTVQ